MHLRQSSTLAGRVLLPLALLLTATAAHAQGTISGRVTEQASGNPLEEARVVVVGTTRFALTNRDGRYTVRDVPAGTHTLRVLRVGFREGRGTVTIASGESVVVDLTLEPSVVQLAQVVTTATGEQRRVELGNAVANIDVAQIAATTPVNNVQDVLAARTPGVSVIGGSQVGGGARVRIRGNSSLNLHNDPIYIIDGVRLTSDAGSSQLFTGGSQPNRANDINPDEIESIEVVKGPSAATLYGTDAANGVVVITTRRGRAGATQWGAWVEGGVITDRSSYPFNYTLVGKNAATGAALTNLGECTLRAAALGSCVVDSLRRYSPFHDPDATVIGTGWRRQAGVSTAGGTEAVRYFMSIEREDEVGTVKLPEFERRRMDTTGVPIAEHTKRPNDTHRYSVRLNVNAAPTSKLDLGVTSNLIHRAGHFATESNATAGIGSHIFGGPGFKDNGVVSGLGTPRNGYRAWTPGYTFEELLEQSLNRVITSANANWRPFSWLQNRANVGIDYTSRKDINLLMRDQGPPVSSTYRLGFSEDHRVGVRNFTADLGSSATWVPRPWLNLRTTLGTQYVSYLFDRASAIGEDLPAGSQTPNSAASKDAEQSTVINKTLGFFVEEQLSLRERLFVTGAVRTDQNSAFGTEFQRVFYPKASLSWILSEEDFFPTAAWLQQFRLRAAYGASGVQPGPNDAVRSFEGTTTNIRSTDIGGVVYTAVGNRDLRPERTTEFEGGFDARLLGERVNLELTYYSKLTKDALISAVLAPSAGAAQNVRRNLGSVKNAGAEALLTTRLVSRPGLGLDVTVTGAINENKLVSLGGVPEQIFTVWRATPGYPLFGLWEEPILGWQDKNGDGILMYSADSALNEVFVGDEPIFRGYSSPRYTATMQPTLEVLGRRLRVSSLVEYKGGHRYYNNTERIRCVSRQNCRGLNDPNASFEEQAAVVAVRDHPARTLDGFFQPGAFVRWREVSATYTLPDRVVGRYLRGRNASINLAARNLAVWTRYRGVDPEVDRLAGSSTNSPPEEFQTLGLPSFYTIRLNLGF